MFLWIDSLASLSAALFVRPMALDHQRTTPLPLYSVISNNSNNNIPDKIVSPVLRKVYPQLLSYVEQYGHPNIPLNTTGGRSCATLRRLYEQDKLLASDVQLLETLGFVLYRLEDVYELRKEEFDIFYNKLIAYGRDFSPPKKYPDDPELGAWVTALRRLYRVNEVDPVHVQALDAIGFSWTSPRQCGSEFMKLYRSLKDEKSIETWDSGDLKWIQAVQKQAETLSHTRQQYMMELLGEDWQSWSPPKN